MMMTYHQIFLVRGPRLVPVPDSLLSRSVDFVSASWLFQRSLALTGFALTP